MGYSDYDIPGVDAFEVGDYFEFLDESCPDMEGPVIASGIRVRDERPVRLIRTFGYPSVPMILCFYNRGFEVDHVEISEFDALLDSEYMWREFDLEDHGVFPVG